MNHFVVSARKYRPSNFNDVVGQNSITTTLSNAIKDSHLAQSFLFCGPRGVGKTTCARILAKTINCDNITEDIIACDQCESCQSFNNHQSFNIHELDAASNNSVDDIRNLVDQVRFAPQVGKYNIYIIDEVHMLSSSAFNAFLKTLEEPPSHAIFILATTEKHKVIPTILSRCQIFDFRSISVSDIMSHLVYVSESEGVHAENNALHIIAQKSEGSLRDALSMFDRLVDSSNLTLTYNDVISNLNILDHDYYLQITEALINHDISEALLIIDEVLRNGFDGHQFIMGLASHLRDLLVCKNEETVILLDKGKELHQKYIDQSNNCEFRFLLKSINLCSQCDVKYKSSKNPRLLVELTLLKIASSGQFFEKKNEKHNNVIHLTRINKVIESEKEEKKDTPITDSEKSLSKPTEHEDIAKIKKNTVRSRKNSFSITEILQDGPDQEKENTHSNNEKSEYFNELKMLEIWTDFTDQVKQNQKTNLYIALTSFSPTLLEDNIIKLIVLNDAQQKTVDENRSDLLSYLKQRLQNNFIDLKIEISQESNSDIPYTPKEKFDKMIQENASLKVLQEKLGLDPDY